MAEEGTFCTNADVIKKAGAGANATAISEAYTNEFIKQAEGRICCLVRSDLVTNYSTLNTPTKKLLREAASNLAAIYCIQYQMSGYTSRVEAEDMVNILTYNYKTAVAIVTDERTMNYSDNTQTTASAENRQEITLTAGEALVNGNVCYLKTSDGKCWKADADAEATAKGLLIMATATIAADASGIFLIRGQQTISGHGFTTGAELYLSTTAGAMTATPPSGSANIIRIAGYPVSSSVILFDPDRTYIEHT